MESHNQIRMIRKRFKCHKCHLKQSSLVNSNQVVCKCEKCGILIYEISEEEYKSKNREDVNKNYRFVFDNPEKKKIPLFQNGRIQNEPNRVIHQPRINRHIDNSQNNRNISNDTRNNFFDSSRGQNLRYSSNDSRVRGNNENTRTNHIFTILLTGDRNNNIRNNNINTNNFFESLLGNTRELNQSPFSMNIITQEIPADIFDPTFLIFGSVFNDIFRNNYSSNFRSNFIDEQTLIDFFRQVLGSRGDTRRPPTARTILRNLKKFNMNEKYCKKKGKDIELPSCSICICDIIMNDETVLLPCGHMYHSKCLMEWLKQTNTCPVCRFELK